MNNNSERLDKKEGVDGTLPRKGEMDASLFSHFPWV